MKRARLGVLIALILIVALYIFRGAGRWLDREDPLSRADVIFVLGGGMPQRAVEAAKVFAQGYAPEVWCSRPDSPADDLAKLGIHYVGEEDYNRQILMHGGVPESAIHILPGPVVNTEEELQELGREMRRNGKTTVILVTSPQHTRRVWTAVAEAGRKGAQGPGSRRPRRSIRSRSLVAKHARCAVRGARNSGTGERLGGSAGAAALETMTRQPETSIPAQRPDLLSTMHRRWKEDRVRDGLWLAARSFVVRIGEFLWESLPAQRRRRYGDAEYDWDHRVNTTSATVGWRERLLGQFHSGYQPTEPALFTEMMASLNINFQEFTFIDLGSGKGRVLLMAADYPFRRIVGVELFPALHRVAQQNLNAYASDSQQCFAMETVCGDAREFIFPEEPTLLYLFNSLPEAALIEVMADLNDSLRQCPREVYLLYHNPLLEPVLANYPAFTKIGGTHQYSLFRAGV